MGALEHKRPELPVGFPAKRNIKQEIAGAEDLNVRPGERGKRNGYLVVDNLDLENRGRGA